MSRRIFVTAMLLGALAFTPRPASASRIIGGSIFVQQDGHVIVEYQGDFADFTSGLFLAPFIGDPEAPENFNQYIFVNNGEKGSPGDQVDLGFFTAGTELVFGLYVSDTGNTFFTGPGTDNFDGIPHAQLVTDPLNDLTALELAFLPFYQAADGTIVGFEDKSLAELMQDPGFPEFEPDYNDLIYSFTNIGPRQPSVPEPATLLLLGGGVAGFIARRRRVKKPSR